MKRYIDSNTSYTAATKEFLQSFHSEAIRRHRRYLQTRRGGRKLVGTLPEEAE